MTRVSLIIKSFMNQTLSISQAFCIQCTRPCRELQTPCSKAFILSGILKQSLLQLTVANKYSVLHPAADKCHTISLYIVKTCITK